MCTHAILHCQSQLNQQTDGLDEYNDCIINESNQCDFKSLHNPTLIYPGGNTRCAFDTDISKKTNGTYRFQVLPGKKSTRDNVLIYFQAGGACVSDITCTWSIQQLIQSISGYTSFITQAYPNLEGIFDRKNNENPFKDWTIVNILYCTGDAHVGNSIVRKETQMYQNGANNTLSVLNWVFKNLPKPKYLVLGGASAGSLGVQIWSQKIFNFYKNIIPQNHMTLIADSYAGYFPKNQGEIISYFGTCTIDFEISNFQTQCQKKQIDFPTIMKKIQNQFPYIPFAYINAKNDLVQRLFYCLSLYRMDMIQASTKLLTCISQPQFYNETKTIYRYYNEPYPNNNVLTYFLNGDHHVVLSNKHVYQSSASESSISILEWIRMLTKDTMNQNISSICIQNKNQSYNFDCDSQITNSLYIGKNFREKIKKASIPQRPQSNGRQIEVSKYILSFFIMMYIGNL